jgi:phosphoserine phosphatase
MSSGRTLLATLAGDDRPGVTRALFTALAHHPVTVLDVEQLVVRGRLVLAFLLGEVDRADEDHLTRSLTDCADQLGLELSVSMGVEPDDERRRNRVHVTVMGAPLQPGSVAQVASTIAEHGGNIDRIRRIASYPVTAIVFESSGASAEELRGPLASVATTTGCDVAVQRKELDRRGQHLVVMDVDSTLIQNEVIDLLADEAGVGPQVQAITERAMRGELDFEQSLRARVALLAGLDAEAIDRVRERVTLTPGARTLCRTLIRLGFRIGLVSGGFIEVVAPIAAELGIDNVRANALDVSNGRLTGSVVGPVIDRMGKRQALEEFAAEHGIPLSRTIAIGDGANDIDMLMRAGLGVAFNAKAATRAAADTAVNVPYLDSVLFLLGITREEIEDADAD